SGALGKGTFTPSRFFPYISSVCWPVPIHTIQSCPTVLTTAVTTPITTVPTPAVMAKPVGNPATPTIRLTGGTGGVIRIQHMPWHRPTTLTTPTKDLQLAIQLNGLFQNLPTSRPAVPRASLPIGNPCRQIPLNGANASQRTRTEPTPPVTHLLPQLDGTLDLDEDYDPSKPENPPPRKRTRPMKRYHLRRTPSVTSNDSSNSAQSSRTSNRHRGHMSRHKQRHSTSSSPSSTNLDHRRDKSSQPFIRQNKPALVPALSPRAPPIRRRWIEERSRQQELAHLVSKAKQANQARLYQSEVEKHTRAYRLRFAIDGVVRAAANPSVAWQTVLSRVAALRERHGLPPLIYSGADGWAQFGLNHRHVIFLVEQMRGAFHCYRYRFQYHRRKVERLRQKFTPPVPLTEGCARALMWTKPRRPAHHARDPLDFLSCAANPPPRPCFTPAQTMFPHNSTSAVAHTPTATSGPSGILSPEEPATMLSPSERIVCAEAARQAASLVASQLKLPMRVREACIARAVVQATGLPINPNGSSDVDELQSPVRCRDTGNGSVNCSDPWVDADDEDDEDDDQDEVEGEDSSELCTVSTQFKSVISGPMTRLLRVAVHPSRIHGRGLFALRGFREDEMIIEYLGERIRNLVCETREIRYRAAGVDCYMFRIDPEWVIDATYAGNAARFINHSCEPNCYAKVISVEDKKHIVILAQRRIYPGEELTYDYRFPKESDKLLCNCGSYMCRRYLN
ncbi:Myeloid/lymphoid or mixed-lineage leukemia, partial [Fasciola gigantica]